MTSEQPPIPREIAERRLAEAEEHIRGELGHIADQKAAIEKIRAEGHAVETAEKTLRAMEHTLEAFKLHRKIILEELGLYRPQDEH